MDQCSFLWPRILAVIVSSDDLPSTVISELEAYGIGCDSIDRHSMIADISYLQNENGSTELAVARLQHLLNIKLSPLSYSLGIASNRVSAYHAASSIPRGCEKWQLPWQFKKDLEYIPVSVLGMIDRRMPELFYACGKNTCDQLLEFGKGFLVQRFAAAGEELWYLLRGKSRYQPSLDRITNDSMHWFLPLPVRTRSQRALSAHLWRLYTTVSRNLDRLNRYPGKLELQCQTEQPIKSDAPVLSLGVRVRQRHQLSKYLEKLNVENRNITHLHITASNLTHPAGQLDLFQ